MELISEFPLPDTALGGVHRITFVRLRREVPERRYECTVIYDDTTIVALGPTPLMALVKALDMATAWRASQMREVV